MELHFIRGVCQEKLAVNSSTVAKILSADVIRRGLRTSLFALIPLLALADGCQSGPGTATGGALGTLTGGLAGAAIGASEGKAPEGALIGALTGGTIGTLAGNAIDRSVERDRLESIQAENEQRQAAVDFAEIIRMTQSGLSGDVIARQIQNQGIARRATIDELIYLKNNGVENIVIQAVQNAPVAGYGLPRTRDRVIYHSTYPDCYYGPAFYHCDPWYYRRHCGPYTEFTFGF